VLPYAQRLHYLPAYLQQLDMESLGKSVDRHGKPLDGPSGIVLWGSEGTNGQHSFHQLLHQGTQLIPCDFIAVKTPMSPLLDHHRHLLACCISQSQALLKGKTQADAAAELHRSGLDEVQIKQLAPHKTIPGNRPSNTLVLDRLDPENLGALIALYEHKTYTLGVLLDINPFDQWGVELGKQLGQSIEQALMGGEIPEQWDSSTRGLIERLSKH
jgi:glucose-6-phosphate isomerase